MSPDPFDPAPDRQQDAGEARRAARPYSIVVGVLFAIGAIVAGINTLSNETPGAGGLAPGTKLPRFAAPSATGRLAGDANVFQNRREAGAEHVPACDVKGRDVIRVCDYFDRPLVLVAWFTRCGTCKPQLDTVERVRGRFPGVAFVGLDIRDSHDNARRLVLERGWRFPMALDRDGAVSALYSIGVGPTIFFAYPGGILADTAIGELEEHALAVRVRHLLSASRRRERGRARHGGRL